MLQIYNKKANIQIKNWAKNLKDISPKEIYIYVYLNAWKCTHHLSHEENANQNHSENISHHKDNYNQKENNNCWWECGVNITLIHCWWDCNLVHFGKFLVVSWNDWHKFTIQLSNSTPRNLTTEMKTYIHSKNYMWTFIATLFTTASDQKQRVSINW